MWHVCEIGEVLTDFQLVSKRKADYVEEAGVYGRIILKWTFKKIGGVDWIHTGQVRDRWRAVVNTVMDFHFP
jgi:hypothetical protein